MLFLLLLMVHFATAESNCTGESDIMDSVLSSYRRNMVPGGSVEVSVEMWIQEIRAVSDISSDFDIDLYVSETWRDPRLAHEHLDPCKGNISISSHMLHVLWTPNGVFINTKRTDIHKSPLTNMFILLYANGTIWTNYRVNVVGPCAADLRQFPFDSLRCSLTYESFNYNIDQPYPAGRWHELTASFTFKRRHGWFVLQAYIPSALTVIVSWLSFCLGPREIAARTFLNINALLALTFQSGNIMRDLPRISFMTAMDLWMLGCLGFVFLALIEMACVGCLVKERAKSSGKKLCCIPGTANELTPLSAAAGWEEEEAAEQRLRKARNSDAVSCVLFPTVFSVLNILYWAHYWV